MLSCCSACPVKACMEIGTSCMFSVRRCAVTTTSSRVSAPAPALLVEGSAACVPKDAPASTAATAYEIFEFIESSPWSLLRTTEMAVGSYVPVGSALPLQLTHRTRGYSAALYSIMAPGDANNDR